MATVTNSKQTRCSKSIEKQTSDICFLGVFLLFIASLLETIVDVDRVSYIPFLPALVLILTLLTTILAITLGKIETKIFRNSLFVFFNLFGALILLSSYYSTFPNYTLKRALQFIVITNCLYLLINKIDTLEKLFQYISKYTVLLVLVASLYGIILLKLGHYEKHNDITITSLTIFNINLKQAMSGVRISSFFGNPNSLGIHLMISLIMCLYLYEKERNVFYIICIPIFMYSLILSGSRASIIGLISGFIFLLNYRYIKDSLFSFAFRFLLVSCLFLFVFYLYFSPEALGQLFSIIGRKSSTLLSGREKIWDILIEQITNTPIIGIGYRVSLESILHPNLPSPLNSHNIYLAILTEVGVLGFFLFFLIYFNPFYIFLLRKRRKSSDLLSITTLSILLAFLVNQLFEDVYRPLYFYFIISTLCLFISARCLYLQETK